MDENNYWVCICNGTVDDGLQPIIYQSCILICIQAAEQQATWAINLSMWTLGEILNKKKSILKGHGT